MNQVFLTCRKSARLYPGKTINDLQSMTSYHLSQDAIYKPQYLIVSHMYSFSIKKNVLI